MKRLLRKQRREIMNLGWEELKHKIESCAQVHSIHPDKLTILFADGSHIHLDNLYTAETVADLYRLWAAENLM